MEVISQLTLAVDLGLAAEEDVNKLRPTFEELGSFALIANQCSKKSIYLNLKPKP